MLLLPCCIVPVCDPAAPTVSSTLSKIGPSCPKGNLQSPGQPLRTAATVGGLPLYLPRDRESLIMTMYPYADDTHLYLSKKPQGAKLQLCLKSKNTCMTCKVLL